MQGEQREGEDQILIIAVTEWDRFESAALKPESGSKVDSSLRWETSEFWAAGWKSEKEWKDFHKGK